MASWQKDRSAPGFVNPYNFVPLSDAKVKREFVAGESYGDLSGVIECTLRTRTPLAMPDFEGLPEAQQNGSEHKGAGLRRGVPFFRTPSGDGAAEVPTIPGSELRGMIRSAFEALDNGCLSVNNSNIASARSPLPLRPAILEIDNGVLRLFDARKAKGRDTAVRRIWPELGGRRVKRFAFTKLSEVVYLTQRQLRDALSDYFKTVDMCIENADNPDDFDRTHTTIPRTLPQNGSWVVFYTVLAAIEGSDQEDILYLSPAQITRTVFRNRVNDLLGSHAGCGDSSKLCEPCFLFGMVGKNGQAASHLRFGDARLQLEGGETWDSHMIGGVTLKELSSPKPSSLEFYTKRPVNEFGNPALTWTYDGATFEYKYHDKVYEPVITRFPPNMPTLVRGRKFFLHHYFDAEHADEKCIAVCSPETDGPEAKTIRNITTELVKSASTFTFRIYFDRINDAQLKKLVWTLCIGENQLDGVQMHKIGHGKPLGLGSAKIVVDRVLLRSLDDGYSLRPWGVDNALQEVPFDDQEVVHDFCTITNYSLTKGLTVSYPQADSMENKANSKASHNWFVANRSVGKEAVSTFTPSVYRALPSLPPAVGGRSALVLPKFLKNSPKKQSEIDYPFELAKEQIVSTEYHPRLYGSVLDVKGSAKEGRQYGHIKTDRTTSLFFHTGHSPELDIASSPLKQGMRVSYLVGKNTGGKKQDCAIDIRIEE